MVEMDGLMLKECKFGHKVIFLYIYFVFSRTWKIEKKT